MLAIPRKQRAMVRKGIKNNLKSRVSTTTSSRFFAAVCSHNVHRHGTPALPKRYFQALREVFGADCRRAHRQHAPEGQLLLSSVLSFYFRDEILPYYAGDDEAARDLAANDFKYWELMRHACARGIKVFDYGRSKVRAPAPTPSRRTGASSRRRCTTSTACTSATRCRRTTRPTPSTSC